MHEFNNRPKKRRAHGRDLVVPADLYRHAVKRELRAEDAWHFCPVKREATVRSGHIEGVVQHYPLPFRFVANGCEDGLYLEHGYKVLVAFHPGHPERGCYVFNAETGSFNRDGYKFGEPICLAPMSEGAPQVNLSPRERQQHARKNANAAVRAEFRAIPSVGTTAIRSSTARNGFGDSARIEQGTDAASFEFPEDATRRLGAKKIQEAHELRNRGYDEATVLEAEAAARDRGDLIPL